MLIWRMVRWLGLIVLGALVLDIASCGGRARSETDANAGSAGSSSDVKAPCPLCDFQDLSCTGPGLSESQSSTQSARSAHGCDYLPWPGLASVSLHIECPDTPTCLDGSCPGVAISDDTITVPDEDGG
jgi:hypothetical protein